MDDFDIISIFDLEIVMMAITMAMAKMKRGLVKKKLYVCMHSVYVYE